MLPRQNLAVAIAQDQAPTVQTSQPGLPGQPRSALLNVTYTRYHWWLARYSDNDLMCDFAVEHPGIPTALEISEQCGKVVSELWAVSKPCPPGEDTPQSCPGLYLIQQETEEKNRDVTVELPMPSAWIEITDCDPAPGERRCRKQPLLQFKGLEPLPNEMIISIEGTLAGIPFVCPGSECRLPIAPTSEEGAEVIFWANSSFGDSTPHYLARVRLMVWGDFTNPEEGSQDPPAWYIDILSDQWVGGDLATCSETWQVFPPPEGPPEWLSSPTDPAGLRTDVDFHYLAGQLIHSGVVNAAGCADGGLETLNIASTCGVEAARPYLGEWQNRYDPIILESARLTGIPALLMKSVFARESQLWPGIFTTHQEAGLGQLTDLGADTLLMWNTDLYTSFCPLVLAQETCGKGYVNLELPLRQMLRGALVQRVNSACTGCEAGIDISQATNSVRVFSEGLLANCEQVGQVMRNITGLQPGTTTSYDDLWRFTLVNYNAGPGCLGNALNRARNNGEPLDWNHVSQRLEPACQGAIGYVEDISSSRLVAPTPTPWLGSAGAFATPAYPSVGATPTFLPTGLVRTATPTPTPTATAATATITPTPTATPAP